MLKNSITILAVCKNKRKVPRIRKILPRIVYKDEEKAYFVPTTDPKKPPDTLYRVSLDANGDFFCKCDWLNFKPYALGMKRHKQVNDCIHILAVKVFIILQKHK